MLVDSHCHLDYPDLAAELPEHLRQMQQNGVGCAVCVGVTLEDSERLLALVDRDARLLATVGLHPETTDTREASIEELCALALHPKVIAIGETGLDYYWHKDKPEWQRERFRTHIQAAIRSAKPLIIHNRDATEDILRVLREEDAGRVGGILHCFTGDRDMARQALDLGLHVSFSGIVTFKSATQIKDAARYVPIERLLVETDAPYLAPVPYRGKTNCPAYVRYVAEEVARLREVSFEILAEATTENFFRLFPQSREMVIQ